MGGLAVGLLKAHLNSRGEAFRHVRIAGIFFSAPRVFQGDQSQTWVHDLIGRNNIFRINVQGDPVTVAFSRRGHGFRSLGVLFLETVREVNQRMADFYQRPGIPWLNVDDWLNYHYSSSKRDIGNEFDPNVVMKYSDLQKGFQDGRAHLRSRDSQTAD